MDADVADLFSDDADASYASNERASRSSEMSVVRSKHINDPKISDERASLTSEMSVVRSKRNISTGSESSYANDLFSGMSITEGIRKKKSLSAKNSLKNKRLKIDLCCQNGA